MDLSPIIQNSKKTKDLGEHEDGEDDMDEQEDMMMM
jgi:hypothetical protein